MEQSRCAGSPSSGKRFLLAAQHNCAGQGQVAGSLHPSGAEPKWCGNPPHPKTKIPLPSSFDGQPRAPCPALWLANGGDPVVPGGRGGRGQAPMLGCSRHFRLRVPSQLARLEQRHMKYDDFLLERRREGGEGGRTACSSGGLHAGGCREDWPERSAGCGDAAPRGWPRAPRSLTGRMRLPPRWAGRRWQPGDAAVGCQAWGPAAMGDPAPLAPMEELAPRCPLGSVPRMGRRRCAVPGSRGLSFSGGLGFG